MSNESLPRPLPATIPDYWGATSGKPVAHTSILSPRLTPMRKLSDIELSTIEIVVDGMRETPQFSILWEAAVRLSIFQRNRVLPYASDTYVAKCLQDVFWPHSHHYRMPWRGLELLRVLSMHPETGVTITLAAEPEPGTSSHRPMSLRDLLRELAAR